MSQCNNVAQGLEVAWLEHDINEIMPVVIFLEKNNFIVHVRSDPEELGDMVLEGNFDVILTDLRIPGARSGATVIDEFKSFNKTVCVVPVSGYLDDYRHELDKDIIDRAIDKSQLFEEGPEYLREKLLMLTGGGRIRVVESLIGFLESVVDEICTFRIENSTGERREMELKKQVVPDIDHADIGDGIKIKVVERKFSTNTKMETHFSWIYPEKEGSSCG